MRGTGEKDVAKRAPEFSDACTRRSTRKIG